MKERKSTRAERSRQGAGRVPGLEKHLPPSKEAVSRSLAELWGENKHLPNETHTSYHTREAAALPAAAAAGPWRGCCAAGQRVRCATPSRIQSLCRKGAIAGKGNIEPPVSLHRCREGGE